MTIFAVRSRPIAAIGNARFQSYTLHKGGGIAHSERGGQFIGDSCQKFLGSHALICSITEVGYCGDNAACEGLFGILKRDWICRASCRTRSEARADMVFLLRFHNPRTRRRVARRDRKLQAFINPSVEAGQNRMAGADASLARASSARSGFRDSSSIVHWRSSCADISLH